MGIFGKSQKQPARPTLPRNIVSLMERFGRFEFYPQARNENSMEIGMEWAEQVFPVAQADPEGFMKDLADAVLPVGGWAVYGASRTLWEAFGSARKSDPNPSYNAIMSAAINFLLSNGVLPVRGYEMDYWIRNGRTNEEWIQRRPIPSPEQAPITALRPNEVRRVTQLTAERDSSAILVRQNRDGQYCGIVETKWSDEDPRRVQNERFFAASLHELYIQIGLEMQIPTYWYDRELEPYFPLPRPKI